MEKLKTKDLISILKLVLIPQLKEQLENHKKTADEFSDKDSNLAWFYTGVVSGEEEYLKTLNKIVDALEGKGEKNRWTKK